METPQRALEDLNRRIIACKACPRLVEWRQSVGRKPPRQYIGWRYWSKPLPGFGDPCGPLMIIGLAPAAHGGNRTGRIFTGDRSATFLFEALYEVGLANLPDSRSLDDGLKLQGAYLSAVVRCAPPANKPTPQERDNCIPYLIEEIEIVQPTSILCLGRFAWDGILRATVIASGEIPSPRPRFFHGAVANIRWKSRSICTEPRMAKTEGRVTEVPPSMRPIALVASYHPSQQNTFTGKLTKAMLVDAMLSAVAEAEKLAKTSSQ
ncbi:MAG: uracil-DNA glycosylase [Acidimicrobiia bacterium]